MVVKRRSFTQARKAAGYTQEGLAERLGVDRTTVARWESGKAEPKPWQRPRIAEAFGLSLCEVNQLLDAVGTTGQTVEVSAALVKADGAQLAGYEQAPAAKQDHEAQSRVAELASAYAETQALWATAVLPQTPWETDRLAVSTVHEVVAALVRAVEGKLAEGLAGPLVSLVFLSSATWTIPAEFEDQLYDQLKNFLGEWADKMNRRELLRLLRWVAATVATSPVRDLGWMAAFPVSNLPTDEQERFTKAVASPGRVDARVIDHIEVMLQRCKRQEDALGPQAVLQTVLAQRELVNYLLDECPDELRPRLLSVYSSMSSSVGIYYSNLEYPASAMHYYDQAREAAQEARNTELAIYALCMMSHFVSRQGKAHAGIDFAAAAQSLATKTDDQLLQACTAVEFGLAYAVDGQHKESMTEFDRALTGLTLPAGQRSPESPVYWFHEGLVASHQSDCLLRLGKPAEAAVAAEKGLQLFDTSFVSDLAFCTLRLGTARLQCGEVEEAARVVGDSALLAIQSRSARLTSEVKAVRGRMQPWEGTSAVKALDERLAGVGFGG